MRMEGRGYGLFDKTITIDAWDVLKASVEELQYDIEHGNNYLCSEDLARYFAAAVWMAVYRAQDIKGWDWEKTAHARLFIRYFTEIVAFESLYYYATLGLHGEGIKSKFARTTIKDIAMLASTEWECQQYVFQNSAFSSWDFRLEDMGVMFGSRDLGFFVAKDNSPYCLMELEKHYNELDSDVFTLELIHQYGFVACAMLESWQREDMRGNIF